ncbi:L-threonine 3-dehydrogenase [Facklamia miroungae]|uniref:Nucleoside-diphosphate-sugar epimerase n=1 Tax=Facklamia miroungae TaxID=120956 RepID=A0A1G7TRR0_9LACT|nr:L-threonine 3-dehydrogenase [Facklamia miroungae]NKZ29941.1 L-threonine 3-dehydrogenase [Facklamia miroungae]SDG37862.1 Nucleoside-diphosphate-sugar epimerase [Facklamia miroungae]
MKKILITGALGQIGSELVVKLNEIYGKENVVPTDIRVVEGNEVCNHPNFAILDVLDMDAFMAVAKKHEVDTLIHMAALLSAVAEEKPLVAWDINMQGLINGLEVARALELQFFTPSSIGAFGPDTPKVGTPQDTIQRPTTMYGITKVAGELLCDYYHTRFGVDTRGVRFPGLISYVTPPGGGTTDYAVQIYYDAIKYGKYVCNIPQGVKMDMMYMPDAIQAIIDLMEADASKLVHRNAFNISGMSFEPEEIAASIRKVMPEFEMTYDVNPTLERIAKSWPDEMDISAAKEEWNFKAEYDLDKMTVDMLEKLEAKK